MSVCASSAPPIRIRKAVIRRPRGTASGGRVAIYLAVASVHAAGLAALGLTAAPVILEGGAAPVITLTLTPRPRFDSETPPAVASQADRAAQQAAAAAPDATEVRLRAPTVLFTPEVSLPLPAASPSPVRATQDAAAPPGMGAGTGRGAEAGAAGPADSGAGATQGGGGQTLGAAAATDTDAYAAEVLAWIERHKRHPGGARGVVTVTFRLDRRGHVRGLRLTRSSGVRALDRSAMDQILATQPFPRPDARARWSTREFTINIDYRARR